MTLVHPAMLSSRRPARCTKSASATGALRRPGTLGASATLAHSARGKHARQAEMLPWITVSSSSQGCSLTAARNSRHTSRSAQASTEDYLRLNHRLLKGFSVAGSIIVALVLGSGLVNSWMLVGPQNMLSLHATLYGQLLIAKLFLFAIMLALAATNRFTLTPALERALQGGGTYRARRRLQISLIIELSLAAAIIGLVAWLGTLEPPVSR